MKHSRHKWNGTHVGITKRDGNSGGITTACVKCGCVREYVRGFPTYFIDDRLYHKKAAKCDERLLKENKSWDGSGAEHQ